MSKEPAKSGKNYKSRKSTVLILQLMPLFAGMVGLYLVSTWSIHLREVYDVPQTSVAYYLGLILIMLALQVPVMIEIYRRRAKKFVVRRVLAGFVALIASLILIVWNVAPDLESSMFDHDTEMMDAIDD
jgi:hypothetical protein